MKPNTKVQTQIPPKSVSNSVGKGVKQAQSTNKKSMGAATKVVLATVVGLPVVMLSGMKWIWRRIITIRLSPDFFYRCEREYPRAVDFVRRYIPLNWPAKKESVQENDFSTTISSNELESEVTQLLQNVETSLEEEEVESDEKVEGVESGEDEMDIAHALAVLALARVMMEKEKEEKSEFSSEEKVEEESEIVPEETQEKKECEMVLEDTQDMESEEVPEEECGLQEKEPVEKPEGKCESQEECKLLDTSEQVPKPVVGIEPSEAPREAPETLDVVMCQLLNPRQLF